MGIDKLSTVYGRIIIGGEFDKARRFINSMEIDKSYPYIQKEMFNTWYINEYKVYKVNILISYNHITTLYL